MSSNSVLGASRETMDLLLGQNNITKLPVELWRLQNLTLLSLSTRRLYFKSILLLMLTYICKGTTTLHIFRHK